MCGIVGVISSENTTWSSDDDFFSEALLVDQVRGYDSTGIFQVMPSEKDVPASIFKRAMNSNDFLDTKTYDLYKRDINRALYTIGHNRSATKGAVSNVNAHPFQAGDFTLVHNGTLFNYYNLCKEVCITDSEHIVQGFSEHGVVPTLEKLQGAFALVFHNAGDGTLNIVRNTERPLAFGVSKKDKAVYIASELQMLKWIAMRNKLDLDYFALQEGYLVSFHPSTLPKYKATKVNLKAHSKRYTNWGQQKPKTTELATAASKGGNKEKKKKGKKLDPYGLSVDKLRTTYTKREQKALLKKYDTTIGTRIKMCPETMYLRGWDVPVFNLEGYSIDDPWLSTVAYNARVEVISGQKKYTGKIIGIESRANTTRVGSHDVLIMDELKELDENGWNGVPRYCPNLAGDLERVDEIVPESFNTDGNPIKDYVEDAEKHAGGRETEKKLKGPHGEIVGVGRFAELVKDGCCFCGNRVDESEHNSLEWLLDRPAHRNCYDNCGKNQM